MPKHAFQNTWIGVVLQAEVFRRQTGQAMHSRLDAPSGRIGLPQDTNRGAIPEDETMTEGAGKPQENLNEKPQSHFAERTPSLLPFAEGSRRRRKHNSPPPTASVDLPD